MQYKLTIELDNEAMDCSATGAPVAALLRQIADRVEKQPLEQGDSGGGRDGNGNTVARWKVIAG